ncbi:GntR family transcriptional regulator [Roseobacter sp.]|uniref:GntR family transcriptional regulator n=1 Tax=Roseobacter sp. TaxID=1907202 RepID=UPI003297BE70
MSDTYEKAVGAALTATPLHEQVTTRIAARIADGQWPEGFVLPPEAELARQLGVSYGTVRRAMQALTQDGLVIRRRRTGTVVTGRAPRHSLDRWYKYYRLHSKDGQLVNTETRNIDLYEDTATLKEAQQLRLTEGAPIGRITRLRISDGRPVMIDRIALPIGRLSSFPQKPEDLPPLLYKWLLDEHGLRLGALREEVTARIANDADRRLLNLDGAAPVALLQIDEVGYDLQNEPLLVMQHSALTDEHCYINEVR